MGTHEAGWAHAHSHGLNALVSPLDVNELDPKLWAETVKKNSAGELSVGGLSLPEIIAEHGSPCYVLDEQDFRNRARSFNEAFPECDVYYAGKSFLATKVVTWLAELGLGLDVCSAGELAVALKAGFDPTRIGYHGNNKSVSELANAIEVGVGKIVVDSIHEIEKLAELVSPDRPQKVMIRLTTGVEAHTHEYIATAHEDQKFGFSIAGGAAMEAVQLVLATPGLELIGLHSHIGSQIFDSSGFKVATRRVLELQKQIKDKFEVEPAELNLGGGFGIAYTSKDDPEDPKALVGQLIEIVHSECVALGLKIPRLAIEPGRAIVGSAMFTAYTVGTVKVVNLDAGQERYYVSVDGGMSDNIRTALYDADYSATLANRNSNALPVLGRIVGKHCEAGDIVVKDEFLPADIAPGDLIAVPATGAYCRSMASNYNHVLRPPVVSVRDGKTELVLRRETLTDLLATDVGVG